ncbi:MAG: recombinase family protein [Selenomonadaceae bacterium]|nr:recombinase family protein [Selenomonadaceae bacterium]
MKKGTTYGYIRVSTVMQHDDRQRVAMREFGVESKFIFADKQSGKDFNRPAYKKLMKKLSAGDVLVIQSLDRLGRDYNDILEQWRIITKKKRAYIVVLNMPILDTRVKIAGDLTGTLISDLVLQLLSYVAQMEREMNLRRTLEGIAAAKARGVKFGRRPMERPKIYETIRLRWEAGELSAREAAKHIGIAPSTFRRWVKTGER